MADPVSIIWFRNDLRLEDNPALVAACKHGSIVPVYIHSEGEEGEWKIGGASKWWLHFSLASLAESLEKHKIKLVLLKGQTVGNLQTVAKEAGASKIFFNRHYEPWAREQEYALAQRYRDSDVELQGFDGSVLFPPDRVETKEGKPYKVFTPFWQALSKVPEGTSPPHSVPTIKPAPMPVNSLNLIDLDLLPKIDWAGGIREAWEPGEAGARKQLKLFIKEHLNQYQVGRNLPATDEVSRISPHLHFGEISPAFVWEEVREAMKSTRGDAKESAYTYLKELGWREFAHHLLYYFPETANEPLRPEFGKFPWTEDRKLLRAWQKGKTGFPIVDAGMRQLWHTGWMHNRVRMVVASFLVKDLLIGWQEGAKWFWDTLVDADLANNTLGWQWSAGCGADAAPYFRVFNPVLQGEKFDPLGQYVRQWVPELRKLSNKYIHKPWAAPPLELLQAQIELGSTYPKPVVDHAIARERALAAFETIRKGTIKR